MKKQIAMILAVAALASSLAACAKSAPAETTPPETTTVVTEAPETTEAETTEAATEAAPALEDGVYLRPKPPCRTVCTPPTLTPTVVCSTPTKPATARAP